MALWSPVQPLSYDETIFFYSPDKILLTKYTLHLSRSSAGKGQSSYAFKSKAFPSEKQLQQMAAYFLRRQNLLYYW